MKKTHLIILLCIGLLIGYIATTSSSYSTYETFETAYSNTGKDFQVVGKLEKDKAIFYNPQQDPNYFSFYMKDNKGEVRKVVYKGTKPQDFERSEQIVLNGSMQGEEFMASKILLKCPSKYIKEGVAEGDYIDAESLKGKEM